MQIGVVFPQTEFSPDPIAVREYTQSVEGMGYKHIHAYDHVLGANPERPGGWAGPYTHLHPFFEPFVLFSYMTGLTHHIEFATGILILPQRQTALVAKQAATLDVLSNGRFRLGVGNGWNEIEYIALNENFHNRGVRMEEQVSLLRRLWAEPLVNFQGRFHTIPDAGLNPMPIHHSIPIWFGGTSDKVIQRMARLGDGWMLNIRNIEQIRPALDSLKCHLDEAGRDKSTFGIDLRLNMNLVQPDHWRSQLQTYQGLGATHVTINTMGCGFSTPSDHLVALKQFADQVGLDAW